MPHDLLGIYGVNYTYSLFKGLHSQGSFMAALIPRGLLTKPIGCASLPGWAARAGFRLASRKFRGIFCSMDLSFIIYRRYKTSVVVHLSVGCLNLFGIFWYRVVVFSCCGVTQLVGT